MRVKRPTLNVFAYRSASSPPRPPCKLLLHALLHLPDPRQPIIHLGIHLRKLLLRLRCNRCKAYFDGLGKLSRNADDLGMKTDADIVDPPLPLRNFCFLLCFTSTILASTPSVFPSVSARPLSIDSIIRAMRTQVSALVVPT